MRRLFAANCVVFAAFAGCYLPPNGSSLNRAEAQQTSDAFMSDLVMNRADLALLMMEPEVIHGVGEAGSGKLFQQMFDYCGRPLEAELRHDETGFFVYKDGRKAPMWAFFYSGKTTQHEKGVCIFAVRVVPGDKRMRVVNFGPLKLVAGELPAWAR